MNLLYCVSFESYLNNLIKNVSNYGRAPGTLITVITKDRVMENDFLFVFRLIQFWHEYYLHCPG